MGRNLWLRYTSFQPGVENSVKGKVIGKRMRIIKWICSIVGMTMLWLVFIAILIARAGAPHPEARGDAAIVLGAAVWDDEPSPVFAARIDHALDLYRRGQVKWLIFTGGRGEGDSLSEGEAARIYASSKGISSEAILVEEQSRSTVENLTEAIEIMRSQALRSCVIVSDPAHMMRSGMIARRLGVQFECSPTETSRFSGFLAKLQQVSREAYFVTRLQLFGI